VARAESFPGAGSSHSLSEDCVRLALDHAAPCESERRFHPGARGVLSPQPAVAAGFFVQKLYYALTESGTFYFLVHPMFLFAILWTYVMRYEAPFRLESFCR
jgi:hypothetical protein